MNERRVEQVIQIAVFERKLFNPVFQRINVGGLAHEVFLRTFFKEG